MAETVLREAAYGERTTITIAHADAHGSSPCHDAVYTAEKQADGSVAVHRDA